MNPDPKFYVIRQVEHFMTISDNVDFLKPYTIIWDDSLSNHSWEFPPSKTWSWELTPPDLQKTNSGMYSDIGQKITKQDIGKVFVRNKPKLINRNGNYDYSHIPSHNEHSFTELSKEALKLVDVKDGELIFRFSHSRFDDPIHRLESDWNDENWCTLDTFCAKRHIKPICKINEIEQEIESLSEKDKAVFDRLQSSTYLQKLHPNEVKILKYLEGTINLEEIGITLENAASFSKIVKLVDLAALWNARKLKIEIPFKRSTYEIRTRILELCSPLMSTTQAYTLTLCDKKMKNADYLQEPSHWVPERVGFVAKIYANAFIKTIACSKRLKRKIPTIYAARGTAASMKSEKLKKICKRALDENGQLHGSLNPDHYKVVLKEKTSGTIVLTNRQVHDEAVRGPLSLMIMSLLNRPKCLGRPLSIILDKRNSSPEDYDAIHSAAKRINGRIRLIDMSISLSRSMRRVLATRDPRGAEPCVSPEAIRSDYAQIEHRLCLINQVKNDRLIDYYNLFYTDEDGTVHLIAKKRGQVFTVLSKGLFEACYRAPTNAEIDRQYHQIITPEYIDRAVVSGDCPAAFTESFRQNLLQWTGHPLSKALEKHSLGVPLKTALTQIKQETSILERYGDTLIQPFTGDWLNDFPQILRHLHSEQRLHIRGVDDEGRGTHWVTGKFRSDLDPKYNSEMCLQMKLGYFIVPKAQVDTLISGSLSPKILKELEVRNADGQLIGYRFFVHPEAYQHFGPLHEAGIPFLKSESSEFIGTPTSSYRSWAIRRIVEEDGELNPQAGSIPFIIKLGVGGGPLDSSRLLSRGEIEKSLKVQAGYDIMDPVPVNKDSTGMNLVVFFENMGIILKDIPNYPPRDYLREDPIDSGIIVREFPSALLEGRCQILSFSALMSTERVKKENQGFCFFNQEHVGMESLPLIYEIMDTTIRKRIVNSPAEFIHTFLIEGFLKAIEPIVFQKGLALPFHGQNLCMVLNPDNTPEGFAIRDHGDTNPVSGILGALSSLYRYHVLIKGLNVVTRYEGDFMAPPIGAPKQIGSQEKLPERNLNSYLFKKIADGAVDSKALAILKELSIAYADYRALLQMFDEGCLKVLSRYFDLGKSNIHNDGQLPAAEIGSSEDVLMYSYNKELWKHRY